MDTIIVWFRRDLRLSDNQALSQAAKLGGNVLPLYIYSPEEEGKWAPGGASKWWLHNSLKKLSDSFADCKSKLVIRRGEDSFAELQAVIKDTQANAVYWNRLYDPILIERDKKIKSLLISTGLDVKTFQGNYLLEPWDIKNSSGRPFQVFTPFWKKLQAQYQHRAPLPVPKSIRALSVSVDSLTIENLKLLPKLNWTSGIEKQWTPGEEQAKTELGIFLKNGLNHYVDKRDFPAVRMTSSLSPYLHFGEISPTQIWETVKRTESGRKISRQYIESYLRQLGWREFANHLLFHFPYTPDKPLKNEFTKFPWKRNNADLVKWQKGLTGYPIVDAGMRELWQTGIMHNRVRMVAASFLVKHLLQPWQKGAEWFWDTLVDADLANNTLGWQWVSGCGADAAPYFRVFNPVLQGEKFDKNGEYVRRFVPELKLVPDKWIHKPWEAPENVLKNAGVTLGKSYPLPIIDLTEGRDRALDAYETLKYAKAGL